MWRRSSSSGSVSYTHLDVYKRQLVPMLYLDTVADAMLKGLDEQVSSLRYSIIDSAISVVLILSLIHI